MIQCGDRASFALEAFAELLGGNFERDNTIKARVAGLVQLSIPPLPMGAIISYRPSLSPGWTGMCLV